ncbi:MAG: hypothetical protein NC432_15885 [Roseburia sp.]|nr:hypothetical protein [Roseburia sp.]MCM1099694.1 hypothetical protein [Ruminococcus flavefaciens]
MKKGIAVFLTAMMALSLAGCGNQIPELTKEELQMVGEYAAITVMKYNNGSRSRLVELLPETTTPEQAGQPELSEESEEPSGMRPTEDTPIVNPSGEIPGNTLTAEDVLGLPEGVRLEYREYEVCKSYPYQEGEDNFLTANAEVGKMLLVLHFSIVNDSGQDQDVDLTSGDYKYRITVNESYNRNAWVTMLLDDMTGFHETVPAGSSAETALLIEVGEDLAAELSSISLKIRNDSDVCTIQLL